MPTLSNVMTAYLTRIPVIIIVEILSTEAILASTILSVVDNVSNGFDRLSLVSIFTQDSIFLYTGNS